MVVSDVPYVVGATSEVVVVCVDLAGVSTNVQLVRRPRAKRLMAVNFMMVCYGLVVSLVLPTAGQWMIPSHIAMGCNPKDPEAHTCSLLQRVFFEQSPPLYTECFFIH